MKVTGKSSLDFFAFCVLKKRKTCPVDQNSLFDGESLKKRLSEKNPTSESRVLNICLR